MSIWNNSNYRKVDNNLTLNDWMELLLRKITTEKEKETSEDDFWQWRQKNLRYTFELTKEDTSNKYRCQLKQDTKPYYYNGEKINFKTTALRTIISEDDLQDIEINMIDLKERLDISYYQNSEISDESCTDRQFKEPEELLGLLKFECKIKEFLEQQFTPILLSEFTFLPHKDSQSYELGNHCGIKMYTKLSFPQFYRVLRTDAVLKGDEANAFFPVPMDLHLSTPYKDINVTNLPNFSSVNFSLNHIDIKGDIEIEDRILGDQMADCYDSSLKENNGQIERPINKKLCELTFPKKQLWYQDIFGENENNEYGLLVVLNKYGDKNVLTVPGGRRALGETALEAAMRELYEETKIRIKLDLVNKKFIIVMPSSETDANTDNLSTNLDSLSLNESNCLLTNLASPTSPQDSRKTEQECEFLYHRNPQAGTNRFLIRVLP